MNYSPRNLTSEVIGRRAVARAPAYKHQAILRRRGWTEVRWMEHQAQVQASRMLTEELQREDVRGNLRLNQEEFKRRAAIDQRLEATDSRRLEIGEREAEAMENIATVLREWFHHMLNNPRG